MTETAEPVAPSPTDEETERSVSELLGELGREVGALAFYEARLAAARHEPTVRRAARDVAAVLVVALAFLTAFALANAAAVRALSPTLSDWLAPLVLAAAWTAVGVVLALFLRARAKRLRALRAEDAELARDEAATAARETLDRLAPAITRELALAALPLAGDVAGGVVDAGGELIESADEIIETITEDVPGGGLVNQVWDVVLMPGRFGVRVATTVLRRGDSGS